MYCCVNVPQINKQQWLVPAIMQADMLCKLLHRVLFIHFNPDLQHTCYCSHRHLLNRHTQPRTKLHNSMSVVDKFLLEKGKTNLTCDSDSKRLKIVNQRTAPFPHFFKIKPQPSLGSETRNECQTGAKSCRCLTGRFRQVRPSTQDYILHASSKDHIILNLSIEKPQ